MYLCKGWPTESVCPPAVADNHRPHAVCWLSTTVNWLSTAAFLMATASKQMSTQAETDITKKQKTCHLKTATRATTWALCHSLSVLNLSHSPHKIEAVHSTRHSPKATLQPVGHEHVQPVALAYFRMRRYITSVRNRYFRPDTNCSPSCR